MSGAMRTSEIGLKLIRDNEGLKLQAYRDGGGVWTIGYGTTHYEDGRPVKKGDNIPTDAVEITDERHVELMEGQSNGQQIVGDENGFPILITPEPVVYIPTKITMRQCRLQLLADEVLDDVEAAVAAMPRAAQIEWEYASEVERENQLVPALMDVVSWDEERADQFFTEAAAL